MIIHWILQSVTGGTDGDIILDIAEYFWMDSV